VPPKCGYLLGGFADQYLVGHWCGTSTHLEQRIEGGVPCPAPVEPEDELVEVVLQVGFPQSVIDAQAQRLRFENSRWIQGSAMCAAIGPSVIAL